MSYAVVTFTLDGKQRRTRIPKADEIQARLRIAEQFPGAEITDVVIHGQLEPPAQKEDFAASIAKTAMKLNEVLTPADETRDAHPVESAQATHTKFPPPQPPGAHVATPAPDPPRNQPAHPAADLGKTPLATELQHLSAANAPAPPLRPEPREPVRKPVPALGGTRVSDAAIAAKYPTIGDSVRVDVERVPYMERLPHHHWLVAHGMHGSIGIVQGTEVKGGLYGLVVETGSVRSWVDARCVTLEPLPEQPPQMQPPSRKSPEKMRKHSSGAYNLT